MAVTFLILTLESWLTPHFKGTFMYFPTKQILIIFDEVLSFMKDPTPAKFGTGYSEMPNYLLNAITEYPLIHKTSVKVILNIRIDIIY